MPTKLNARSKGISYWVTHDLKQNCRQYLEISNLEIWEWMYRIGRLYKFFVMIIFYFSREGERDIHKQLTRSRRISKLMFTLSKNPTKRHSESPPRNGSRHVARFELYQLRVQQSLVGFYCQSILIDLCFVFFWVTLISLLREEYFLYYSLRPLSGCPKKSR